MDEKKLGSDTKNDMQITFDAKNDVLYCSFGAPREAYSVETEDGVFVRLNPENDTAVGITVVDFCKKFAEQPGRMLTFPIRPAEALHFCERH